MQNTHYSSQVLRKLEFSPQIFEKYSNRKFHKNPARGSRVVSCARFEGRKDMKKLIASFRNFANSPKRWILRRCLVKCWNRIPCCLLVLEKVPEAKTSLFYSPQHNVPFS